MVNKLMKLLTSFYRRLHSIAPNVPTLGVRLGFWKTNV